MGTLSQPDPSSRHFLHRMGLSQFGLQQVIRDRQECVVQVADVRLTCGGHLVESRD